MNPTITEQQQRFLELRTQGKTYDQIASDLGVSRRTLFYWNQQLQEELAFEETAELETLRQELLGTRQARARRLAKRLAAIEDELDKRSLADLSTARLFTLADSLRRQLTKETTPQTHDRAKRQLSRDQMAPSECNDSAIAVQPESGRANLPVSPEQVPALRPAPIQESTNPSIQSASQCNDSAIPVQPTPGRANFPVSPDQTTPSTTNTQPSTPSAQCNDSAIAVQPDPGKANPFAERTVSCVVHTSVSPDQTPSLPAPPTQESTLSTKDPQPSTLPKEPSIQSSKYSHIQPISPERLIGPNINFREVLEKRRLANKGNPSS